MDVIKVECLGVGDDICVWGLLFLKVCDGLEVGVGYFIVVNCGKCLIMIDISLFVG